VVEHGAVIVGAIDAGEDMLNPTLLRGRRWGSIVALNERLECVIKSNIV